MKQTSLSLCLAQVSVTEPANLTDLCTRSKTKQRNFSFFLRLEKKKTQKPSRYSELFNKHAANLILFENIFPPTCLIRTYTFIYFQGKFLPTRLLEYLCLLILAEIPSYKIILSSFKLLFCCFKNFKEASKS